MCSKSKKEQKSAAEECQPATVAELSSFIHVAVRACVQWHEQGYIAQEAISQIDLEDAAAWALPRPGCQLPPYSVHFENLGDVAAAYLHLPGAVAEFLISKRISKADQVKALARLRQYHQDFQADEGLRARPITMLFLADGTKQRYFDTGVPAPPLAMGGHYYRLVKVS